jgi:hypothetical protein
VHVQWSRRQLRSNRQVREILCPHDGNLRPWVIQPHLVHYEDGHPVTVWCPAPTIRECCAQDPKHSGFALAAWWWEVDQRFSDLSEDIPDPEVVAQLLGQKAAIRDLLSMRVPFPSEQHRSIYLEYREETGLTARRKRSPLCFKQLGLKWPCTREDVSQRWRELVKRVHPDRGGSAEDFTVFNQAYRQALRKVDASTRA